MWHFHCLPRRLESIGSVGLLSTKSTTQITEETPIWCLSISWQCPFLRQYMRILLSSLEISTLLSSLPSSSQFMWMMPCDVNTYSNVSVDWGRDGFFFSAPQHRPQGLYHKATRPVSLWTGQSHRLRHLVDRLLYLSRCPLKSLNFGARGWEADVPICRCARRRLLRTPDSWRSSTSGKCSGTSLSSSQSWCCDPCRSRAGHSRLCRGTSGCRRGHVCRRSQSQGWGRRNWASFHSKPGLALSGVWSSCTWVSGSPPIHGTPCVSPPPSLRRCHTCPSCSRRWLGNQAETTSMSWPRSCLRAHGTYTSGTCCHSGTMEKRICVNYPIRKNH